MKRIFILVIILFLLLSSCVQTEQDEVFKFVREYYNLIKDEKYSEAYDMFSEEYKTEHSYEEFKSVHKDRVIKYGVVESIEYNKIDEKLINENEENVTYNCSVFLNYTNKKGYPDSIVIIIDKERDEIKIIERTGPVRISG